MHSSRKAKNDKSLVCGILFFMARKRILAINFVPIGSRLTFLRQVDNKKATYRCVCGSVKDIGIYKVNIGETRSCGCYQREVATINASTLNGLSSHPLWSKWRDIWNRRYNENTKSYSHYGGKGVVMCELWEKDFMSFFNWAINNGWREGLEIDKDIKAKELKVKPLLYSPERCQFVTGKKNCNNRGSNKYIEHDGVTKTLMEWSETTGVNYGTLAGRLKRGWRMEQALKNEIFHKYSTWKKK